MPDNFQARKGESSTSTLRHPSQRICSATESILLNCAKELSEAMFSCDLAHPFWASHLAPEFKGKHDRTQDVMSIAEYIELARELKATHHQGARMEISNEWVDFDKTTKEPHATVWQFVDVIRSEQHTVSIGLRLSRWRLDPDGAWLCYYCAVCRTDPLASGYIAPCF